MGYTQSQIDALQAAIAQGVLVVQYTDKRVEYRSLSDMLRTLNHMRQEMGTTPKNTRIYASFTKGLEGDDE